MNGKSKNQEEKKEDAAKMTLLRGMTSIVSKHETKYFSA